MLVLVLVRVLAAGCAWLRAGAGSASEEGGRSTFQRWVDVDGWRADASMGGESSHWRASAIGQ
jgi:hypothetical protein